MAWWRGGPEAFAPQPSPGMRESLLVAKSMVVSLFSMARTEEKSPSNLGRRGRAEAEGRPCPASPRAHPSFPPVWGSSSSAVYAPSPHAWRHLCPPPSSTSYPPVTKCELVNHNVFVKDWEPSIYWNLIFHLRNVQTGSSPWPLPSLAPSPSLPQSLA